MQAALTLEQIRAFLWTARLGGVRRAAARMNLSQPAVSARIAALEAALRVRLFERSPAGVSLTRKGEAFLVHAEHIALSLETIRLDITEAADLEDTLHVGVAETIAQAWLPQFLAALAEAYPRLSVEVTVDISRNLRDGLTGRALDLAILIGPVSEFSIANLELPAFALAWFRAPGRDVSDLSRVPVISYARSTRPYQKMRQELLRRHGARMRIFPTSSLSAGFQMVASDLGVGALPHALAQPLVQAGAIVAFDPGWCPPALRFTASWRSEPGNALAERAAAIAREVALRHRPPDGFEAGDP